MKNKAFRIFLLALLLFSLSTCKSKRSQGSGQKTEELIAGTLVNLTGLDGCGWVIKLDKKLEDGTEKLEPTNLNTFNIPIKDGQAVLFSYVDFPGASVCMVGKIVELKAIKLR